MSDYFFILFSFGFVKERKSKFSMLSTLYIRDHDTENNKSISVSNCKCVTEMLVVLLIFAFGID